MLTELRIQDIAIIEALTIQFGSGLNILTGETGAGKSILLDSINLVLGGKADTSLIRAGCEQAWVEATFEPSTALSAQLQPLLEEQGLADESGLLVLGRELRANGRNLCRINGRTVNASLLREIASQLIDIHGQAEHLSLFNVKRHLSLLDRYANLAETRQNFSAEVRKLQEIRRNLHQLQQNLRTAAQRADLLRFQVEEIRSAGLVPGEDKRLQEERTRLANAEKLASLCQESLTYLQGGLNGSDGEPQLAVTDLLGKAGSSLERLTRIDPSLLALRTQAQVLLEQLQELAGNLEDYAESIEYNPLRLTEVEERLRLLEQLKRKYGDSLESVVAFGTKAQAELAQIENSDEAIAHLQTHEQQLLQKLSTLAHQLSLARQAAATLLAQGVSVELQDLRMAGAEFAVAFDTTPDSQGLTHPSGERVAFDTSGYDHAEFMVAPNRGEGLKPMVKIASGGETARLMLALKGVLARADDTPTLIFDEIDQGIGGRVGTTVGEKLWHLARSHQVLCITHLPQLAVFGDSHYRVAKEWHMERTRTQVNRLAAEERVVELAQMLGADSASGRASVLELLASAAGLKKVENQGANAG
jgi:DNA repair protein RecN (Recombination protein N)